MHQHFWSNATFHNKMVKCKNMIKRMQPSIIKCKNATILNQLIKRHLSVNSHFTLDFLVVLQRCCKLIWAFNTNVGKAFHIHFWQVFHTNVVQVLRKWDAIDDEIWAKAIVMERNKRVAKVRWSTFAVVHNSKIKID